MQNNFDVISKKDFITSVWSGGSTTQIAIQPQNAVYANRDFLWRISSATVELPTSDFTPLQDYNRIISLIDGQMSLTHDNKNYIDVLPMRFYSFDGAVSTKSSGLCTDFNVMLSKDKAVCDCQSFCLPAQSKITLCPSAFDDKFYNITAVMYFVEGNADITHQKITKAAGKNEACFIDLKQLCDIEINTHNTPAKIFYCLIRY